MNLDPSVNHCRRRRPRRGRGTAQGGGAGKRRPGRGRGTAKGGGAGERRLRRGRGTAQGEGQRSGDRGGERGRYKEEGRGSGDRGGGKGIAQGGNVGGRGRRPRRRRDGARRKVWGRGSGGDRGRE